MIGALGEDEVWSFIGSSGARPRSHPAATPALRPGGAPGAAFDQRRAMIDRGRADLHDVSPIRSRCQRHKSDRPPWRSMLGSALAFLMFELLLRGSVPHLALRYHKYLPGGIFMLAQHSKGP